MILSSKNNASMRKFFLKILVVSLVFSYIFAVFTPLFPIPIAKAENGYVEGRAECVMELNSRRVLYEKCGDTRLPMASTTKILTAITVLERYENIEKEIIIPEQAVGVEGSSVYLKKDEKYTIKDLLYGLMLRSGNDCAVALAVDCAGNEQQFSAEMNKTAQKAGALNSNFLNPHGLPCEGHFTTAHDLNLIACYAMHNTKFREIVSTRYYQPKNWTNKNKILQLCEGGIGIKTGYTKQAGRCLVSAIERNGMTLVSTVLNCPTTYERSCMLLEDAFSQYSYEKLLDAGTPITVKTDKTELQAITKRDYFYPLLLEEKELVEIRVVPSENCSNRAKKDEIIGQFELYLSKQLLFSGNLYKL